MRDPAQEHYERGNESYRAGRLDDAAEAYEAAVAALTPEHDPVATDVYENLALTLWQLGQLRPAIRAFYRVLDGNPTARQQSLRGLVSCLFRDGRALDGERLLEIYERTFGRHPEGWKRS